MTHSVCVFVVTCVLLPIAAARAADPAPVTRPTTAPAAPFTIGRETTHATGPLRADGTVDYVAALNGRMADGVRPESNAAVALLRDLGPKAFRIDEDRLKQVWPLLGIEPLPAEGAYYVQPEDFVPPERPGAEPVDLREQLDAIHVKPWNAAEFPVLAGWLKSQDAAISRIAEATRLPRLYLPLVSQSEPGTLFTATGTGLVGLRAAANALGQRAMFRLGSGDFDGYREDVLAVSRLAALCRQRPTFIDQLVAVGVDGLANILVRAAATNERVTATQAKRLAADLDAMTAPAGVGIGIDLGERYVMLDFVGLAARHGWTRAMDIARGGKAGARTVFAGKQNRDWDGVLRKVNGRYDRVVRATTRPTFAERKRAALEVDREIEELRVRTSGVLAAFAPPEDHFFAILGPSLYAATKAPQQLSVERDLTRVALALAAYKADRGSYPKALAELAPAYLPEPPLDAFAEGDRELMYALNGAGGYGLASVGHDGEDSRVDGPLDWRGGDIVVTGGPQPKPPEPEEPPPDAAGFPEGIPAPE